MGGSVGQEMMVSLSEVRNKTPLTEEERKKEAEFYRQRVVATTKFTDSSPADYGHFVMEQSLKQREAFFHQLQGVLEKVYLGKIEARSVDVASIGDQPVNHETE